MKLLTQIAVIAFFVISDCLGLKTQKYSKGCGDWVEYKDEKCFKILEDSSLSFHDAIQRCQDLSISNLEDNLETQKHMTIWAYKPILPTISNAEEQAFLVDYLYRTHSSDLNNRKNFWIGSRFSPAVNQYEWIDGYTRWNYTNWSWKPPINQTGYCVVMMSDENVPGKWASVPCSRPNLVVCQRVQEWNCGKIQVALFEERRDREDLEILVRILQLKLDHLVINNGSSNGSNGDNTEIIRTEKIIQKQIQEINKKEQRVQEQLINITESEKHVKQEVKRLLADFEIKIEQDQDKVRSKVDELERQKTIVEKQITEINKKEQNLKQQIVDVEAREHEIDEKMDQIVAKEEKIERQIQEIIKKEQDYFKMIKDIETNERTFEERIQKQIADIVQLDSLIDKKIITIVEKEKITEKQIVEIHKDIEDFRRRIENIEIKIKDQNFGQQTQKQIDEIMHKETVIQKQIQDIEKKEQAMNERIYSIGNQTGTDRIQKELIEIKKMINSIQNEIDKIESHEHKFEEKIRTQIDEISRRETVIEKQIQDIENKNQETNQHLEVVVKEEVTKVIKPFMIEIDVKEQKIHHDIEEIHRKLDILQKQITDIDAKILHLDPTEINVKIEKVQTEIVEIQRKESVINQQINEVNVKIQEIKTEIDMIKPDSSLKQQIEEINVRIENLITKINDIQRKEVTIEKQITEINSKEQSSYTKIVSIDREQKKINQEIVNIENMEKNIQVEINDIRVKINNLPAVDLIPIGFIYIEYPWQQMPRQLWASMKWEDVSYMYKGAFFRASGDGSEAWAVFQNWQAPRITRVLQKRCIPDLFPGEHDMPLGQWSDFIFSGHGMARIADKWGSHSRSWGTKFFTTNAEVWPRNIAIRIWKRIG